MPKVSVGILTHNRSEMVLNAIRSAYDQGHDDLEVVVVDSASTDGTREAILEFFPSAKYIRLPRNLGCAGGRNHLFANCTGEFIVSLDDDGFLGDGAIDQVLKTFGADPKIGIVAMRQRFIDEPENGREIADVGRDVGNFWGGVSAFRRSTLEHIGYYPEDFFLFGEESYLAIRAFNAGYRIVSEPRAVMWHPRVGSSASYEWDYYRFRNPMLVVTRLFPGWLLVKYLFLRNASYLLKSFRRGTTLKYLAAAAFVFFTLPKDFRSRDRCSAKAVKAYFSLR